VKEAMHEMEGYLEQLKNVATEVGHFGGRWAV
jgi:hypothetical protein